MDLDTGETIAGVDTFVDHNESTIFITQPLTVRRHYNITVHASNSAGSATSYTTISKNCFQTCSNYYNSLHDASGTHDIIAAIVTAEDNEIVITTQYFEESSASGALYVLVFVTDEEMGEVDWNKSVLVALDRETSCDYTLPFSLSPGGYRVYYFVYDITSDRTLPSGVSYPAVADETSQGGKTMHTTREGIYCIYYVQKLMYIIQVLVI